MPATFLWLILNWFDLPGSPWFWATSVALICLFAPIAQALCGIVARFTDPRHRRTLSELSGMFVGNLVQCFFYILFLAHQYFIQLDAIVRVFYRSLISKQKLLEWAPAVHNDV